MRRLTEDMRLLITRPLSVHPGASFMNADQIAIETQNYESCWGPAYSYYTVTKSHQSMLGAQRISKAGACSVHTTIKKVHDESVVEVSNEEWMSHLSLGSEAGAYESLKTLLEAVSAMVPE